MLMSAEFSRAEQLRDQVGRAHSPCVSVTTEEHTNTVTRTVPLQGSSVLMDAVKSEGEIRPRLPGSVRTTLSHHTGSQAQCHAAEDMVFLCLHPLVQRTHPDGPADSNIHRKADEMRYI